MGEPILSRSYGEKTEIKRFRQFRHSSSNVVFWTPLFEQNAMQKSCKHFARFHTFIKSDISQAKLTAFEEVLDNQIFEQTYWKKSEI